MVSLDGLLFAPQRTAYTAYAAASHFLPSPRLMPSRELTADKHLMVSVDRIPEKDKTVPLIRDVRRHLGPGNGKLSPGIAITARHLGDIDSCLNYDGSKLEHLMEACIAESMPLFITVNGVHWTAVGPDPSPLIDKLMGNYDNRVLLKDPNGKFVPAGRKNQLGISDDNGLSYLSFYAPEVQEACRKNLGQLASVVAKFAVSHPKLFAGISTPNETDLPGKWAGKGWDSDYNKYFMAESLKEREKSGISWQDFRVKSVRDRNELDAAILLSAGIPKEKIYTHVSTEDAVKRASPISVGIVPSAGNLGVVWWGHKMDLDFLDNYAGVAKAKGKGFGIMIANPLSISSKGSHDFIAKTQELDSKVTVIYPWNFTPGYGFRGTHLQSAARKALS